MTMSSGEARSRVDGIRATGALSESELRLCPGMPDPVRLLHGPVAVLECTEPIPCNPCEAACPHGAIRVGYPITALPILDAQKCTGCGLCISSCPGLAICVVDLSGQDCDLVRLPHELLPEPDVGGEVDALDREGRVVGEGRVARVDKSVRTDCTMVVSLEVGKGLGLVVRAFRCREE